MMKVKIKFTSSIINYRKWMKQLLELQKQQGFVTVRKVSTYTLEIKEANMPNYLLSSIWIKEVIEE
jgi:hypothetical protein